MLFQTYFELIDENRLPPSGKFIDPYDLTKFTPISKQESLSALIHRFSIHRQAQEQPAISQTELKQLVVASLYESSNPTDRANYFKEVHTPPNLTQIYSFTRATAQMLVHGKLIPPSKRESRAKHCLNNCKFHAKSKSWSKTLTDTVSRLVGIQEATVSASEKQLGVCMACGGCALKAKVGYSLSSVLSGLTPEQIDIMLRMYGNSIFSQCWITEEALSDPASAQLLTAKISHIPGNAARAINAIQYIKANAKNGR